MGCGHARAVRERVQGLPLRCPARQIAPVSLTFCNLRCA
jgi:hypothetical protein